MSTQRKIFICILLIGLSGCAPTKKIIGERTLSLDQVLQRVHNRNKTIATLKGNGTITVESLEGSNSGSFDVWLKKPDSLKADFSGPFGIHVGTLALSRDQFLFYHWVDNRVIAGKPDGKTLQSMFRLKMEFDEVLNAFTGEFPAVTAGDTLSRFYVEEGVYISLYHTAKGMKEYRIDGDSFVITSYRVLDDSGRSVLNAFASRIEDADNISMPMLVRIIFPKERRSVTIAYDNIDLNKPVDCSFTLPKQAEIFYR